MPVPFNITLTPGAPYVSLSGAYGAGSWGQVFNSGTFGDWTEWTAIAVGPSVLATQPTGAGFFFNGSSVSVYGTMQWEGEGYNITATPDIPVTGLVERWPGCNPISVCLSQPGVLWKKDNLTNGAHNFTISTNYDLGSNLTDSRGPTLTLTHIDITANIPGDEFSSRVANQSIPTSDFTLSPEDQWIRATNGSLYTRCNNCSLSMKFTGTAILLVTAQSLDGFSPYFAAIDAPAHVLGSDPLTRIGVERQGTQGNGEVMYMATGLENTDHVLNIRTTGGFAVSQAHTFQVISMSTADGPPSNSTSAVSSSTTGSIGSSSLSSNAYASGPLWYWRGAFLFLLLTWMGALLL